MPSPPELKDVLAQLRERFVASSVNTIAAFEQLAAQLQATPAAPEVVEALRRELHRVHGTAGSYGFHEASRLAGSLELVAMRWAADPALDRARRAAVLQQFVRALRSALTPADADGGAVVANRVLLVDLPDDVAAHLVTEAVHRGHCAECVPAHGLETMLGESAPQMIIAAAHVSLTLRDGIPLVLLRGADGVVAPHGLGARVLEAHTDPREVLDIAESLAEHTGLAGATMLVVDDDPEMLQLLRAICEREGMSVTTLPDAEHLESELDRLQPAMLLLDIGLPRVNGIAATRLLRSSPRFTELPIVLVSSSTDADTRAAAFVAGADDFQAKPVVAAELVRRVGRLLELRRQRQVARGIHPATGLSLPERTLRTFDEVLRGAAAQGTPASVAYLRPRESAEGAMRPGEWHREIARFANQLTADGAIVGFLDDTVVLVCLPAPAEELVRRLDAMGVANGDQAGWQAGVSELRPGATPQTRQLAHEAEEGWLAAREANERVHLRDGTAASVAPDVIIVEDDPALADLLAFALESRGLTHRVFTTGPAGLDGLRALSVRGRTPVVLLDVDLPGLDGFSLFERIRVERPGAFHVVFLSVRASESDQLRALRAGALDFLAKPVSLRVLIAKIATWRQGANA